MNIEYARDLPLHSVLSGYRPFSKEPEAADAQPHKILDRLPQRTAVLVLHGMGSQKPYETLDQFVRGLLRYFKGSSQRILLRQQKANPNTQEKDWTQCFIRLVPDSQRPNKIIDVYEYYWASVISDRISPLQSLKFLIFTGLTPFQYIRDNLLVINRAEQGASRVRKSMRMFHALLREIARMIFIFMPIIGLAIGLYVLFSSSLLKLVSPTRGGLSPAFLSSSLCAVQWVEIIATIARFGLIAMCVIFLAQEFFPRHDNTPAERSPRSYRIFIALLLTVLSIAPFALRAVALRIWHDAEAPIAKYPWTSSLLAASLLFLALPSSSIMRSAYQRAGGAIRRHWVLVAVLASLALTIGIVARIASAGSVSKAWAANLRWLVLPSFIVWPVVFEFAGLALLLYIVRGFLVSAIGGLAVYLGADNLSKNYAARSQILHECTGMLLRLLTGCDEIGKPEPSSEYDQVLLAAHSLGSVIAYDSLNQLITRNLAGDPEVLHAPLWKIRGLLTFGCPLNKVVYFFRTRTSLRTGVLSRILYLLHPFRLRSGLPPEINVPIEIDHPFPSKQGLFHTDFQWFNAYSPFDLISGRMLFYHADRNVAVERGVTPWTAHLSYWENDDLYRLFASLLAK